MASSRRGRCRFPPWGACTPTGRRCRRSSIRGGVARHRVLVAGGFPGAQLGNPARRAPEIHGAVVDRQHGDIAAHPDFGGDLACARLDPRAVLLMPGDHDLYFPRRGQPARTGPPEARRTESRFPRSGASRRQPLQCPRTRAFIRSAVPACWRTEPCRRPPPPAQTRRRHRRRALPGEKHRALRADRHRPRSGLARVALSDADRQMRDEFATGAARPA